MLKVDKKKCIGCGTCQAVCSSHFQLGEEGKAEAISQEPAECVKQAIEMCPVEAISLE